MGNPIPDRDAREDLWLKRLTDAKLRLDAARDYVKQVQRDLSANEIPAPDGEFAYRKALRAENSALAECKRVLRIFTNLTENGKIPDENDWRWQRGAVAEESE